MPSSPGLALPWARASDRFLPSAFPLQCSLRILARHVVSQLELRRRPRELGDIRRQNERRQDDLEKVRAELAAARRELARRKAKPAAAPRSKAKKKRK